MSDDTSPTLAPPPGAIHELAERAVDFVRHAVVGKQGGVVLDYRPETLPVLDHYLARVPRDADETVALVAAAAGAYFGEVCRRALGGEWRQTDEPAEGWALVVGGGIRIVPGVLAEEAIRGEDSGEPSYDVPAAERAAVEDALDGKEIAEDEYYTLSSRLEVLQLIADTLAALRDHERPQQPETD